MPEQPTDISPANLADLVQGNKLVRHAAMVAAGYIAHHYFRDSAPADQALVAAITSLIVVAFAAWSAFSKHHDVTDAAAGAKAMGSALMAQASAALMGYLADGENPTAAGVAALMAYTLSAAHRPDQASTPTEPAPTNTNLPPAIPPKP